MASAVKQYWIMRDIVEKGVPEAIIFEDDVVIARQQRIGGEHEIGLLDFTEQRLAVEIASRLQDHRLAAAERQVDDLFGV